MFDSLDVAACVAKNGCCVGLRHSHQTLAVDLDNLVVDLDAATHNSRHIKIPTYSDVLCCEKYVPSVSLRCPSLRQSLDENAEFFETRVSSDAHADDAETKAFRA